jgi:hypothetical protein
MSRKGHLLGGGTLVGYRTPTWFAKGSTRIPPNASASKPPLSPAEQAAFQALKKARETGTTLIPQAQKKATKKRSGETGTTLIPKGQKKRIKKRIGKTKAGSSKLSVIKLERSEPNRATTEVSQTYRKGRSRAVAVEFVQQNGSSRKKPG